MFGDFGNDFTFILASSFMMVFYTNVMGIDPLLVGMVMMAARFVDTFTDVTMGQIVDRSRTTDAGKFRPWIKRMCGPVAISSFLIFQSGFANMPMAFKVFWMFFTYILWGSIFYTSVNIPYGSMASAISSDPDDRVQLSTWRGIGATLASTAIGVLTPMFAYVVVDGQNVLSGPRLMFISGVFSVCAIVCYLLCYNLVRERVSVPQNNSKLDIAAMLKSIFTNASLLGIIAAAILLLLEMLGMQGMASYIFPIYYNSPTSQSMATMAGSVCMLAICAPFASKLAAKFGKKEMSAVSCMCGAAAYIICLILRPDSAIVYVGFYAAAYTGLGMFNTVIWAMITDVIDDAELKNGVREDGTIYSVYSFARKLGQAFSSGMIGAVLQAIGFTQEVSLNPGAYPEIMAQVFNWSCLIPAIGLAVVSLALFFLFPLSKSRVDANAAELERRRRS